MTQLFDENGRLIGEVTYDTAKELWVAVEYLGGYGTMAGLFTSNLQAVKHLLVAKEPRTLSSKLFNTSELY